MLSRLVKTAEARRIKEGLRDGTVQIVIGTHALAGQDVRFGDLAILVIDEEQRFGARVKEQLRGSGDGLHVLTMTATPIPRTLQRALVGLQALSTLETPPARRVPIRTMLRVFDSALVRQALVYERRRGGQSFVVCARIDDLGAMSERLQEIVPELRVVVVHGKLPASQVDEAVVAFAEGRGDILLTTNIIETGLDIPRANTIVIWRPERFGAAQLHQLRGRVGRGRRRGLAFLLTDPDAPLPSATQRRLSEFAAADELGAGFMVSRRDLDRRGAGELLGEAQTGHIRSVGAELYANLLGRALAEAGGHATAERAQVRLDLSAFIPADYIPDAEVRINLYARLGRAADAEIEELAEEIEDRFGPLPPAVRNLLAMACIADSAGRLGVAQVDAGPTGVALTFAPALGARPRTTPQERGFHWAGNRLVIERSSEGEERVDAVLDLLRGLPSYL
jgi:transcription-repair coupling factor (superfamily II helicase)